MSQDPRQSNHPQRGDRSNSSNYNFSQMQSDAQGGNPDKKIELLIEFTKDEDARTRATAIVGLAKIKEARGFAAVLVTLFDPVDEVRIAAATALGMYANDRAFEALVECLHDPCEQVGVNCAWALGQLPTTRAFNQLIDIISSEEYALAIRTAAATAIGERAEILDSDISCSDELIENARVALTAQLSSHYDDLRASAVWSLGHLPVKQQTTDACVAMLQDPYEWVVRYAIEALVQFDDANAAQAIAQLVPQNEEIRQLIAQALELLQ